MSATRSWKPTRVIGRGSFGTVYEVERDVLGNGNVEKAAMKVISIPKDDNEIRELRSEGYDDGSITMRFEGYRNDIVSEYALMAKMKGNANIVYCDDVRFVQKNNGIGWTIYIRMELLTSLMNLPLNRFNEEEVVRLGIDMCNALSACEAEGIIHRDIKPDNIFVSKDGNYKLGDFGVSKMAERTSGGTKIGTYNYMAPEVYNNQPYGHAADIYSLGLVLYWLLNKRRKPFLPLPPNVAGYSDEELARVKRFRGEALPAPVDGSEELKRIVLKACAFDPKLRFKNAGEMRQALMSINNHLDYHVPFMPVLEKNNTGVDNQINGLSVRIEDESQGLVESHTERTISNFHRESETKMDGDSTIGSFHKPDGGDPEQQPNKKKFIIYLLATVLIILLACIGVVSCSMSKKGEVEYSSESVQTENSHEVISVSNVAGWSEWSEILPAEVNSDHYEIEEREQIRTCAAETTNSSQPDMEGWELYNSVESGGWSEWSNWSDTRVDASESQEIETQTVYRYRNKETTTSSNSSMSGWELYDKTVTGSTYGSWSAWGETKVNESNTLDVEEKTQYRYRDITTSQQWGSWGSWSAWQDGAVTSNDSTEVETRTLYRYYYFYCPICGGHEPFWGYASDCGQYTIQQTDARITWSTVPYSQSNPQSFSYTSNKLYTTALGDGEIWIFSTANRHDTAPGTRDEGAGDEVIKAQYRYRTRSMVDTPKYSQWSDFSDSAIASSSTREVETRTVYRQREIIPTYQYHFSKWGTWSDWSTNTVTGNTSREVEQKTQYRYREMVNETTYYFRKWGEWSEWMEITDEQISVSDTLKIEKRTHYRFRLK